MLKWLRKLNNWYTASLIGIIIIVVWFNSFTKEVEQEEKFKSDLLGYMQEGYTVYLDGYQITDTDYIESDNEYRIFYYDDKKEIDIVTIDEDIYNRYN